MQDFFPDILPKALPPGRNQKLYIGLVPTFQSHKKELLWMSTEGL